MMAIQSAEKKDRETGWHLDLNLKMADSMESTKVAMMAIQSAATKD